MVLRTIPSFAGITLLALAVAAPAHAADTSSRTFLQPHLQVGEHLSHVFSRAISIKGSGFKEVVARVSGTSYATVVSIGPDGIVMHGGYRYDGKPAGSGEQRLLPGGVTACWNDQCAVDHETSGATFNRTLWGRAPKNLHVGMAWTATIAEPWELGPPGTETVSVLRLDPSDRAVTLFRDGHGVGRSLHDLRVKQVTITTDQGTPLKVRIVPGETHWSGRTIVRDGIIVADTIMVKRHVTLVSKSGRKFAGEERAYTLENLLQDHAGSR
ncbi:MAG: hypothetical protein ACREPY_12750 [Rhodanobacteraceae bacterium]